MDPTIAKAFELELPLSRRPRTWFFDIDGTLVGQESNNLAWKTTDAVRALPGVIETMRAIMTRGDQIVLTTARKESQRAFTERQLHAIGIVYDHLIMSLTTGVRILVNDVDPRHATTPKAIAINRFRDEGTEGLEQVVSDEALRLASYLKVTLP